MTAMLGMDPSSAEALALGLGRSAEQLDDVRRQVSGSLRTTRWIGVDAEQFDDKWQGELARYLSSASTSLVELQERLRRQIEEQLRASDMSTGSGPGFWDGIISLGGVIWDGITWVGEQAWNGISWVGERIQDGLDWAIDSWNAGVDFVKDTAVSLWNTGRDVLSWVGDRLTDFGRWTLDRLVDGYHFVSDRVVATWDGIGRLFDAAGIMFNNLLGLFTGDTSFGQLLASAGLISGTLAGIPANLITGQDQRIFAQGKPFANAPQQLAMASPTDFSSFTQLTMNAYDHGGVLVTTIPKGDGTNRYIVSIGGTSVPLTSVGGWTGHADARDWPGNMWTMASGDSVTTQAVQLAMERAGIPPGSEVILSGHSQGGLTATTLAANPQFNSTYQVQGVVAYGAPVDAAKVPSSIPVLSFENRTDPVPALDGQYLGPDQGNVTHVPLVGGTPVISHQQSDYQKLVDSAQVRDNPAAQKSLESMGIANYYSTQGSVQGVQIGQTFD